jgi:glyoxylase-like metal-dependent hydrolase (beta-lactamase superfamily II)
MLRCLLPLLIISALQAQEWCKAPRSAAFDPYKKLDSKDAWFEVYELSPGEYAIHEPRQAERVFSYLIVGTKKALLFDSGFGIGKIQDVVRQLTPLPVIVLNSHTHYDHYAGNYAFNDVLAVDTAYTRKNAEGKPNDLIAKVVLGPNLTCGPLPEGVNLDTYTVRPFKISRYVRDGEKLDLGGRTLEVLLTPGHTPDAVCLLDRARREMFTGDTFYPGALWLWVPETDLDAYQRSIERLAGLSKDVDILRPAHNAPQASPSLLPKVAVALPEARSGKATGIDRENKRLFRFEGFSILLAK